MPETLPRAIGRYEVQRELGRGMMGVVYEAHDPALGRRIALKTIQLAFAVSGEEQKSFEERFLSEARVAARLSHPGIVVVHDVGQDPETGTLYIALEFLEGRTLAEIMVDGEPIDWRQALQITKHIAEALYHAHAEGVIHRDVKPANIMILRSGEPKIMDFGIAKVETSQLTATGQFFGTPMYMSPEQALGRKLDARSDLFSLGTLAYGLLTGQQAFGATGVPRIITRVVQEDPPPPTHVVCGLPREVDYLIARALAKDPADRYPDGRTIVEDIDDIFAGRSPRHKRSWAVPPRADRTLASAPGAPRGKGTGEPAVRPDPVDPDFDAEVASLVSQPEPRAFPRPAPPTPRLQRASTAPHPAPPARMQQRPAPPRPGFSWMVVAVAGLAVAAIVAAFIMRRTRPEPPAEPVTVDSAPPPLTTMTAAASAAPPFDPLTAPPPTFAAASPEPAPAKTPVAEPRLSPAKPATSRSSGAERAQLDIGFEHSLKYGTLRVWVDDALAIDQELDSHVTRKIAALKLRKGSVQQTLELPAGRHEVKVQVEWDDNVKTGRIWANFDPGSTRRLSAKLGGGIGGLVKKNLDLEWE